MLLALSKFLPRVLHRRSDRSGNDASEHLKQPTCRVVLLDDSELSLDMKLSVKGCILLDRVFLHLNLVEKEYFGLRFLDSLHQPLWLDLSKAINSQTPAGDPQVTFYFGVKFYAVDPCKLNEEITRYQFFLQVKRDIVQGRLPVSVEMAAQLSAYAVQSELGDFNELFHQAGYVSEFSFIPDQTLDFENKVAELHKVLRGQVPAQAEYHYLDTVKWLDMYGVDLHPVTGDGNIDYFLGLTPSGIVVYKNRTKISNYFWPRVLKITYKNKLFLIKARDKNNEETTFTFESSSKQTCKHLYRCCVDYHSFYRLTSASHSFQQSKAKLLSFGSKTSYSAKYGRSESSQRVEQKVVRLPSARKLQMRSSGSESCPEDLSRMPRPLSAVVLSQPVNKSQRRDGYSSGPESSRYSNSAPWEDGHNHRGLYTGRVSPTSVRSEYFPRRITPGSESDSTVCARRRHRCRGNPSDTETEIESCHRRHRIFAGTESESDIGSHHSHHRHRHHRHRGRSAESVNDSDSQWHCCRPPDIHGSQLHGNADSVGSMSSMSSAPDSRRHRRRSKSPGLRPPQELAQHFRKIEDPSELGISNETFQDIPYFRVEVLNQRFSPRTRHRIRQYRRQRSCGELHGRGQSAVPDGEAPPPYLGSRGCYPCNISSTAVQNLHPSGHLPPQRLECERLRSPVTVQMREAQTAPIVKTKEIMRSEEPLFTGERTTRDLRSSSMLHDIGRPSNEYEQIAYKTEPRRIEAVNRSASGQQPPSCRALNVHMREDSGLDLDSPGGSSSSQAAESVQIPSLPDSRCFPPRLEPGQQRRNHSPAAGTPAPSFRTSPYVEQALCEEEQIGFGVASPRWALQSRQSVSADQSRSSHHGHHAMHHSAFTPYPEGDRRMPQGSYQGRGKGHITEL